MKQISCMRNDLYKRLLTLLYHAKSGHIGSSLSCLDILIVLYTKVMKKSDQFILSKGHAVPALYVVLNKIGKISDKELSSFYQNATKHPAHPPPHLDISIPFPSGSLGHGLSLACGVAHGLKLQKKNGSVYCLMSDGECNEGQVWEAAQYASAKKLNNITALIDKNGLQAFGKTKEVLGDGASKKKWEAFGFHVLLCDGHDTSEIKKTFEKINSMKNTKPKVIIFSTVKGHGVSFMENKLEWHYHTLSDELYKKALVSIDKKIPL